MESPSRFPVSHTPQMNGVLPGASGAFGSSVSMTATASSTTGQDLFSEEEQPGRRKRTARITPGQGWGGSGRRIMVSIAQ